MTPLLQIDQFPDVVWGAIVTGLFLTGQQVLNNRREERRRSEDVAERAKDRDHQAGQSHDERAHQAAEAKQERDHQATLAEADHAARIEELRLRQEQESAIAKQASIDARSDYWRDERRTAHLALIPVFEEALHRLETSWFKVEGDDDGYPKPLGEALDSFDSAFQTQVLNALANVQMIGSKLSRTAADACREVLFNTDVAIWVVTNPEFPPRRTYEDVRTMYEACSQALAKYIDTVRSDLGTAD